VACQVNHDEEPDAERHGAQEREREAHAWQS
jgi:hypothetical protein